MIRARILESLPKDLAARRLDGAALGGFRLVHVTGLSADGLARLRDVARRHDADAAISRAGDAGEALLMAASESLPGIAGALEHEPDMAEAAAALAEAILRPAGRPDEPLVPRTQDDYRLKDVAETGSPPVPAGTTFLVTKEFSFDAAHNLPRYFGKCENLHGHTFRVRVTVKAPLDAWTGMACDFVRIRDAAVERVVRRLDHTYLNEIIPNPSAEYIAVWIWRELSELPLHEVTVHETPTSFVTFRGPGA